METPRTDALANSELGRIGLVEADFARQLERENAELREALEVERMRLAACGVVALANTPEAAERARAMHPNYMSAACKDVMRAVDEEMNLRALLAK